MANSPSGESVVDRTVRIIEAFSSTPGPLTPAELAVISGLPSSTVHRLVGQLSARGFLEAAPGGRIQLGLRLWEAVNRNSPTLRLRQAALPFMETVHRLLGQNVNLAVLHGSETLFVERLSRPGSVTNRAEIAGRMPVHRSSAGLVLMAGQSAEARFAYLDSLAAAEVARVRGLLAEVAARGYAELVGIMDSESRGIAVPVPAPQGGVRAALGVVVPKDGPPASAFLRVLLTAARGIAGDLDQDPMASR